MPFFRPRKKQAEREAADRLKAAEEAGASIDGQAEIAKQQVGLVDKLMDGWREVHQRNHLAELFRDEFGGIRQK